MSETTTLRLMAAAKEFNIGKETLVDFLVGKGFSKDDLKPTSKLTEEMYRALQMEFQGDKVAKIKSDQIDLPKGSNVEAKKKKEDEAIIFKKDVKKAPIVEEAPPPIEVLAKQQPQKQVEPPKKEEPEMIKIETPEIEGPKVIDKIDLSTIDSSTRPKKISKKKTDKEPNEEIIEAKEIEIIEPQKEETENLNETVVPEDQRRRTSARRSAGRSGH